MSLAAMTLQLPGYVVTETLYTGTRTVVYRGQRQIDAAPVVIKLLRQEHPRFNDLVQFRYQYTLTKNLELPAVIKSYSLEPYRNGYALVMEDFGGLSLAAYLNQNGHSVTLDHFWSIALQLTDILHALYQQHIIHKDIKPANILIHPDTQQIKLIDFSIASLLSRETQASQHPNELEGTLAYLAPEQTGRMNRGVDYRSDFYALGVTFFELLTGRLPFESIDPIELVHCHLAILPPLAHTVQPALPEMVSRLVNKLMAKNAEDRYQSALGLKHDLEQCRSQWTQTGSIAPFDLGTRDRCDRFLIPETLYGREQEVATLLAAFERVAGGQEADGRRHSLPTPHSPLPSRSELILVAGFSGIGKTAVINEVQKPIVRQRGYFIKGKYDQFQRSIPFSAFVQAFRGLIRQLLSESDAQLEQWQHKLKAALGEQGQVMLEVIPELERLIGQQLPVPELSGDAAQNRFNRLFQQFIQVFTAPDHPLVIFIDDLQWADSASLKLMTLLMSAADSQHLLFIGAYRDHEVTPAHPLMLALEAIRNSHTIVHLMTLAPLDQPSINQLVADTLSCTLAAAEPLAALVMSKTNGNPFFSTQFLKALYEEGQIWFNFASGCWECDIAQVRSLALTDDVVEFMALQLQKLPAETQTVLQLAACIGNQFDLQTLAIAHETAPPETAAALWKALQDGLILPQNDIYKFYQGQEAEGRRQEAKDSALVLDACTYKFLHDRVQQAAYSLIPDNQKQVTHLKIGQQLLSNVSDIEQEEKLFDIVNHLNVGIELITAEAQRIQLAALNLKAGRKALLSTAYTAASKYFEAGISVLAIDCWQRHYKLTLALYEAAAEAAYCNINFAQAQNRIDVVLQQTTDLLDRIRVCELQIQMCMAQTEMSKAIAVGISTLTRLGIDLDKAPSAQAIQLPTLAEVESLPSMTDAHSLASMRLLMAILSSVYTTQTEKVLPILLTMIALSLKQGHTAITAYAYAFYGMVLCGSEQTIDTGYNVGLLGLKVLERFPTRELECRVSNMFNTFVKPWKQPLIDTVEPLTIASQIGFEAGDFEYASYTITHSCTHRFLAGIPLEEVQKKQAIASDRLLKIKQDYSIYDAKIWQQVVENLLGESTHPSQLQGEKFDEVELLPIFYASNNRTLLFTAYVAKAMLNYLFGKYQTAIAHAEKAATYADAVVGFVSVSIHNFYYSLALLSECDRLASLEEKQPLVDRVKANQVLMHQWMVHAPANFAHKYHLIEAEKARVLSDKALAVDLYDRAIALANEHGFLNEAALVHELAARFYLNWGKERIAQDSLTDAYYAYSRWGAKAKIDDLERRYPQLLAPILQQRQASLSPFETVMAARASSHASIGNTTSSNSSALLTLDLAAVLKTSQALSSEIELEPLLATLLQAVTESAGADRCVLLLLQDGELRVTAVHQIDLPTTLALVPLELSQTVPIALINVVKRSLEPCVITHVTQHATLIADPYILRQQPQSVLCTPILHQGKLLGILYLENHVTAGAFTSDRVELLTLLCAQAAISIENARLYQRSQQALTELSASEARFQKLATNLPGMIYQIRVTPDGSSSAPYISSGCADLYELLPDEFLTGSRDFRAMEHPNDRSGITRAMLHSAQTLTPFEYEWRIITPSGKVKWVQAASRPERQADDSIVWDGVQVDISDRKQAEAELQEKEQFLRTIYDGAEMVIFVIDVLNDGSFRYAGWNAAAERVTGVRSVDVAGKSLTEIHGEHDGEQLGRRCAETVATGMSLTYEDCLTFDGQETWWFATQNPLKNADGRVYRIIGTTFNITDRKRAEAALKKSLQERKYQARLLQTVLDSTQAWIFAKDQNFRYVMVNRSYAEAIGQTVEAILGSDDLELGFPEALVLGDPEKGIRGFRADDSRALAGEVVHNPYDPATIADGSQRIFDTLKSPLYSATGDIFAMLGFCNDVTELKHAETQLRSQKQALEQTLEELQQTQSQMVQSEKMSGLGQLVAGVAHEINNPVNFIYGNLTHANSYTNDLLGLLALYQTHYPTPHTEIQNEVEAIDLDFLLEDLPKLLASMRVGAERIQKIVSSLRNFSRMDEAEVKAVNLHEGIDSTLMILQHRLKATHDHPGIKIIKEYGNLPLVECYAGQLNQVFMNVLSNAIDALEECLGQKRDFQPTIIIRTTASQQQVRMSFADNGSGIPDVIKLKLFDPFFTTKPVGKGTGMGLSISHQIVTEKHGGSLQCLSAPGQGTEFIIEIPIQT